MPRSKLAEHHRFQGGGSFGSFAAGASKAREPLGTRAACRLSYAQKRRQQRSTQLLGERPVPSRQRAGDRIAKEQCLPSHAVGIETVVGESKGIFWGTN